MHISILIASHNEGDALWRTLLACIESTHDLEREIIVVDDASTDKSIDQAKRRFPEVRYVRQPQRLGAAPSKHRAALEAAGDILVFLDGHTNPEQGAIQRIVETVELLDGRAIVTPAIANLDVTRWENSVSEVGYGYWTQFDSLESGWLSLSDMQIHDEPRRKLYESPSLIGCALAVTRDLYERLRGFDRQMLKWGIEDVDFGVKAWLMGAAVLNDPEALVGHRFRATFDNFQVPPDQLIANQLRFARKHFTPAVWENWVNQCRERSSIPLKNHPEGLWTRSWELFQEQRTSIEEERSYFLGQRSHDEFWYADRFHLEWPRLSGNGHHEQPAKLHVAPPLGIQAIESRLAIEPRLTSHAEPGNGAPEPRLVPGNGTVVQHIESAPVSATPDTAAAKVMAALLTPSPPPAPTGGTPVTPVGATIGENNIINSRPIGAFSITIRARLATNNPKPRPWGINWNGGFGFAPGFGGTPFDPFITDIPPTDAELNLGMLMDSTGTSGIIGGGSAGRPGSPATRFFYDESRANAPSTCAAPAPTDCTAWVDGTHSAVFISRPPGAPPRDQCFDVFTDSMAVAKPGAMDNLPGQGQGQSVWPVTVGSRDDRNAILFGRWNPFST